MPISKFLSVPDGSNITMYNVLHYSPWKHRNSCKDDILYVVYRDETGRKRVDAIRNPEMELYFVDPKYRSQFITPREYIEMDKVRPVRVPHNKILPTILDEIKRTGGPESDRFIQAYNDSYNTGNYRLKKELHKWPYVCMSDVPLEEYYCIQIGHNYNLRHDYHIIDKCFLDIENDVFGLSSTEQKNDEDPINAVTIIFDFDKNGPNKDVGTQVYTYLLRDYERYPQQAEFEYNMDTFIDKCSESFDKQSVKKKDKVRIMDTKATYNVHLFDTEEELIQAIFDTINYYKPDVCKSWSTYDITKITARMLKLGMNPVDVISDKELFREDSLFIDSHIDNRPIDLASRNSYIRATTTTTYEDQVQQYAGIRKGAKSYGSNRLDNIGKIELGVGKWEFAKGIDVTNAAIYDYRNFVLYNIRDVWVQTLIDMVTNDTMALIYEMNQQNALTHHLSKQTKFQKYIYYVWYLRKGFVPGNNVNVNYLQFGTEDEQERQQDYKNRQYLRILLDSQGLEQDEISEILEDSEMLADLELDIAISTDDEVTDLNAIAEEEVNSVYNDTVDIYNDSPTRKLSLPGGLIGDPDLNLPIGEQLIPGVPNKHFFDHVMDQDYASEYPYAKYTRSLSRSTQIGRLIIPKRISLRQNTLPLGKTKRLRDNAQYLPGGEFVSDLISQDMISLGACWFNLPDVSECVKELDAIFNVG